MERRLPRWLTQSQAKRLKDLAGPHEAVDTPDQATPHRKDARTRAGRCGQQWETPKTFANRPTLMCATGCQELCE
ncbi:unnamed protein product [Pleuronectes platessa]|uniref:Uncharacterized protein n=1 Tax=Pleuronectes platessa TaxID=8262 RepID=A0A9N7VIV7_PLEPL|nr:unnamed protein product [Pleuronectes platessa]